MILVECEQVPYAPFGGFPVAIQTKPNHEPHLMDVQDILLGSGSGSGDWRTQPLVDYYLGYSPEGPLTDQGKGTQPATAPTVHSLPPPVPRYDCAYLAQLQVKCFSKTPAYYYCKAGAEN